MLRRPPTAITLTTEDIANYEDARAREAQQAEQAAQQQTPNKRENPNDELRPHHADRARGAQVKTREERLGIQGGSRNEKFQDALLRVYFILFCPVFFYDSAAIYTVGEARSSIRSRAIYPTTEESL
ncbi:hypothetical protein B0O99DRAFT_689883 [Bisporella sp. PMI_857]|nr:hypothetical protein B0O99DRAFT_689883 [Bisporella sp. PMI_857]